MKINYKFILLLFVLVSLNVLTGGYLEEKIMESLFSGQGNILIANSLCLVGVLLYNPVHNIGGYDLPMPTAVNVMVSLLLTTLIVYFMDLRYTLLWKDYLVIFLASWVFVKMVAFALIRNSVAGCESYIGNGIGLFDMISVVLIPLIVIDYLVKHKK